MVRRVCYHTKNGRRDPDGPIFDNGSSLFPNLIDVNEMQLVVSSEEETNKRVFLFPTSQVRLNGRKSSYYEVIDSLEFEECNNALLRVYNKIDLAKIENVINDTPLISGIQKSFYLHMVKARYEKILKASYVKLLERG